MFDQLGLGYLFFAEVEYDSVGTDSTGQHDWPLVVAADTRTRNISKQHRCQRVRPNKVLSRTRFTSF